MHAILFANEITSEMRSHPSDKTVGVSKFVMQNNQE